MARSCLQNAFDAALMVWLAGIPERIGYRRDGRGMLLTRAIEVPEAGDIPRHERFYYLELLRRAGLLERFPESAAIRLDGIGGAREAGAAQLSAMGVAGPVIGISPGAAYGNAKRWLPERFAESGRQLAGTMEASVLVFGAAAERALCETVAEPLRRAGIDARNLAGETSLREFIDLAAACRVFLTNDSGAMHVASALACRRWRCSGQPMTRRPAPRASWRMWCASTRSAARACCGNARSITGV